MSSPDDRSGPQIFLILLALVGFVALVGGVSHLDEPNRSEPVPLPAPVVPSIAPGAAVGGLRDFAGHGLLVADDCTAGTGWLGLPGDRGPDPCSRVSVVSFQEPPERGSQCTRTCAG